MMKSRTSSIGSSTSTALIPMRGIMTSWICLSPSSMTPWIISFSASSIWPWAEPVSTRSFSSSTDSNPVCGRSRPPNRRTMNPLIVVVSQTSGLRNRSRSESGRAASSANRSGKFRARVLGTSSPAMIEVMAMSRVTRMNAIVSAADWIGSQGMAAMASAMTALNATAPMAEARKPRKVIATWMVARKRCGSSTSRWAVRAPRRPSSASWSSRVRRTVSSAISAAANTPPTRIRTRTMRRSTNGLPVPAAPSGIRRVACLLAARARWGGPGRRRRSCPRPRRG